jgi:hypothetical protein
MKFRHAATLGLIGWYLMLTALAGCGTSEMPQTCLGRFGTTCDDIAKLLNDENRESSQAAKEGGCEVLVKQVALDVALRRSLGETQSAVLQHYRSEFLTGKMPMPSAMQDAAFDTNSRIVADVYALPEPLKSDAVDSYAANVERLCEEDDAAYNFNRRLSTNLKAARGNE